jgi:hypothetical protein
LWHRGDAIAYAEKLAQKKQGKDPVVVAPISNNGKPHIANIENNFGKLLGRVGKLEARVQFMEQLLDSYTMPTEA